MSDTTTIAPQPKATRAASVEPSWAKPAIGILNLCLFIAALAVVILLKNTEALSLLIGAVITNASTVINYYFGSSAGSDRKTDLITQTPPEPSKAP